MNIQKMQLKKILILGGIFLAMYGAAQLIKPPNTQFLAGDDERALRAQAQAQSQLDYFIDSFQNKKKPGFTYSVYRDFFENGTHEHMWIRIDSHKDGVFSGRISEDAVFHKQYKEGAPATAKREDVEDWAIFQDGIEEGSEGTFIWKEMNK